MDKKYQIFISSTFTDLIDERQGIIQAILGLYHIPIGMEMFSAEDEDQWEIIRRTIDVSDYYVLILGLRYGSKTSEDISYTQKEYEYALEKGIPILTFIMNDDVAVPKNKRDDDLTDINKFRTVAKTNNKMVQFWSTKDELVKNVSVALMMQIMQKPRIGWVRGDNAENNQELSLELARLSKENRELKNQLKEFEIDHPKIEISYDKDQTIEIQTYQLPTQEEISLFKRYLQENFPKKSVEIYTENDRKFDRSSLRIDDIFSKRTFKGITETEISTYNQQYETWLHDMSLANQPLLIPQKTTCFTSCFQIENTGSKPAQDIYVRIISEDNLIFIPYLSDKERDAYKKSQNPLDIGDCRKALDLHSTLIFKAPPKAPEEFDLEQNLISPIRTYPSIPFIPDTAKPKENNQFYYLPDRPTSLTNCIELICPKFFHHNKETFEFYFIIPETFNNNSISFTIEIQAENLKDMHKATIQIPINKKDPVSILDYVRDRIKFNLSLFSKL